MLKGSAMASRMKKSFKGILELARRMISRRPYGAKMGNCCGVQDAAHTAKHSDDASFSEG